LNPRPSGWKPDVLPLDNHCVHRCARYRSLRRLLTDEIRRAPWHSPWRALPCLRDSGSSTPHPSTCRRPSRSMTRAHRLPLEPPSSPAGCGWRPGSPLGLRPGFLVHPPFGRRRFVRIYWPALGLRSYHRLLGTMDPLGVIRGLHGRTRCRAQGRDAPLPPGHPEVSLLSRRHAAASMDATEATPTRSWL
jgi:hypothetical protein